MARIARIVLPGRPHLVCQKGSRRILSTPRRRQAYLDILSETAGRYQMKVLAWSILPGQVSLVLVPPSAEAMSGFMRVAHARYARLVHPDFEGSVTPRRFASCPLDPAATVDAIRYVESLPVIVGQAEAPDEDPFSSAAARNNGTSPLLAPLPVAVRRLFDEDAPQDAPLPAERVAYLEMRMRTGKPAGDLRFVRSVERKVGMNLSRGRGRPPKNPRRRTTGAEGSTNGNGKPDNGPSSN